MKFDFILLGEISKVFDVLPDCDSIVRFAFFARLRFNRAVCRCVSLAF